MKHQTKVPGSHNIRWAEPVLTGKTALFSKFPKIFQRIQVQKRLTELQQQSKESDGNDGAHMSLLGTLNF